MGLTLFCNMGDPTRCDVHDYLQTLVTRLCTAECGWNELQVVGCGACPPFDGLWGTCPVPPDGIVVEQCSDCITLWGLDQKGDWTPIFPPCRNAIAIADCSAPQSTWPSLFGSLGPPSTGAILIQNCNPRIIWTWNGTAWQSLNADGARVAFSGFMSGDFFVASSVPTPIPGLAWSTVQIPSGNCPNWYLVVRVQGYHYWQGCQGNFTVYVNGVQVGNVEALLTDGNLFHPFGVSEIILTTTAGQILNNVEIRLARDAVPCVSGSTIGVRDMYVYGYLYPAC